MREGARGRFSGTPGDIIFCRVCARAASSSERLTYTHTWARADARATSLGHPSINHPRTFINKIYREKEGEKERERENGDG